MNQNTATITYTGSVKTPAGFRSVEITAEAVLVTEKMAQVSRVLLIDGEVPSYGMSRTGANRQKYNGKFVADSQIGARKRLSACRVAEVAA